MKKVIAIFLGLFLAGILFAEETYQTCLAKAKSYEAENKFIYALASYYDAMTLNPTASAKEAYESFLSLGDRLSKKDESEWETLYREFTNYFSDQPVAAIYITRPYAQKDSDEDFYIEISIQPTYKFKRIFDCISKIPKDAPFLFTRYIQKYELNFELVNAYGKVLYTPPTVYFFSDQKQTLTFTTKSREAQLAISKWTAFARLKKIEINSQGTDITIPSRVEIILGGKPSAYEDSVNAVEGSLFIQKNQQLFVPILDENDGSGLMMTSTEITEEFYQAVMGRNPEKKSRWQQARNGGFIY